MKHFLISAAACLCLAGCASTSGSYGPASGSDLGYSATKIQSDRFRINYTSRNATESKDFALLRAAEIAKAEGYSHFKIVGGGSYSDNNGSSGIATNIGVSLGGGRYNRSGISVGVSDIFRALEGRKVTETLEVILLERGSADDRNVYEAQSVMNNIVPPASAKSVETAP